MKKYTSEVKDAITGFGMVLEGASYNFSMDWLRRTLKKYGVTIGKCEPYRFKGRKLVAVHTDRNGESMRTFYYDEDRGFLLGD